MQNLIIINGLKIETKEYQGQRVVTFKDIDKVHDRPEGTAGRNFRANKKYFIEGEDYYKISPDEIRRHKIMNVSTKLYQDVVFITESGYLMLVKSFTDELAWKVQRELVNTYFRMKQQPVVQKQPYEYRPKYFRGIEVATMADLEYFTHIPRCNLHYYFNHNRCIFKEGADYWFLKDSLLREFKAENNDSRLSLVSCLIIVTKSGYEKLAKQIQHMPRQIECFGKKVQKDVIPEEMKMRYIRITEANLLRMCAVQIPDPFYREFVNKYITQILMDENLWTPRVCKDYAGCTSNFDVSTLEGHSKVAVMSSLLRLMNQKKPLTNENVKKLLNN